LSGGGAATPAAAQLAGTTAPASYPPARQGWLLVGMLTLAYIFSYLDRSILGLLIQPIKADLQLSDKQIGWVIGPAFAVFYATMGLPLGWLVDRGRRMWIVGVGIVVWSIATAASGLARNFWQLFTARMAVGIGEATLSPAAFSMIGDSFPPEKRGKPIAVYAMALSLGAGIGGLISAFVIPWAKRGGSVDLGFFGVLAPWQVTLIAVGLPGLLVAVMFLLMPEPPRQAGSAQAAGLKGNGLRDALGYVGRHAGTYACFVSLVCVMTIIAYSHQFMAPTFQRTWGWPAEKYALVSAVALILIGPSTVLTMGWLVDRWAALGAKDAPLRLMVIGFAIMLPTAVLPYFMPSGELAYAVLCINTVGIAMMSAVNVTALLLITPAPIRGQVEALFYVVISLSGLFLGPLTVGKLSTDVFGEREIRLAMAAVPVIYGIVPLLLIPLTLKLVRRRMAELAAT
jgi:MFS family permease